MGLDKGGCCADWTIVYFESYPSRSQCDVIYETAYYFGIEGKEVTCCFPPAYFHHFLIPPVLCHETLPTCTSFPYLHSLIYILRVWIGTCVYVVPVHSLGQCVVVMTLTSGREEWVTLTSSNNHSVTKIVLYWTIPDNRCCFVYELIMDWPN